MYATRIVAMAKPMIVDVFFTHNPSMTKATQAYISKRVPYFHKYLG
jgi:hypothetical protein